MRQRAARVGARQIVGVRAPGRVLGKVAPETRLGTLVHGEVVGVAHALLLASLLAVVGGGRLGLGRRVDQDAIRP